MKMQPVKIYSVIPKRFFVITFIILLQIAANAQPTVVFAYVTDSSGRGSARYAEIRLLKTDTVIHTDQFGRFRFLLAYPSDTMIVSSESLGCDTLLISRKGDQLTVKTLQPDSVIFPHAGYAGPTIKLPGSCKSLPVTDVCPKCHSKEHVIRIVYGYPAPATIEKADAGLIWLGGCMVDDCMPRYYCKDDKIEF
jgi:hypothetical protein